MSGKLIIAWDFITHHVRRDGKQALKVSLDKRGYLDLGAAVVRTDLIKQTGAMFLPPNVTNKEWRYFERDMLFFQTLRKGLTTSQRKQGVELVHQILMAHN
jgi:hypothetical protein